MCRVCVLAASALFLALTATALGQSVRPPRAAKPAPQPAKAATAPAQPAKAAKPAAQPGKAVTAPAQPGKAAKPAAQPGKAVTAPAQPGKAATAPAAIQKIRPAKVRDVQRVALPDLVVTDFQVTQPGQKTDDLVKYPFTVEVKNAGEGRVSKNFYVSILLKSEHHDRYDKTHNHFRFGPLSPGQSKRYQGTFTLMVHSVSGKTAKLKAWVDSGRDEEFPPKYFHVAEADENNNLSAEVSVTGAYAPYITSVSPTDVINRKTVMAKKHATGQQVRLAGQGFGKAKQQHDVGIFPVAGGSAAKAAIKSWHEGVIFFTVPKEVNIGKHRVAIVDGNTMQMKSNALEIDISHKGAVPWSEIVAAWDLFGNAELHIHTRGSGSQYQNSSTLKMMGKTQNLNVSKIEFRKKRIGRYRYLIQEFNSKEKDGIRLSRELNGAPLNPHQLKMDIEFESGGVEAKGYFKSVAGGGWNDGLAPDIDIDNAKVSVFFNFRFLNGRLDYNPSVTFGASVNAHADAADWLMDLFQRNWDKDVKNKIRSGILSAVSGATTKRSISDSLMDVLYLMIAGFDKQKTVRNIEFLAGDIIVTYR